MRQHEERGHILPSGNPPCTYLFDSLRKCSFPAQGLFVFCCRAAADRVPAVAAEGVGALQSDLPADLDQCNSGYRHRARHTDSQRNRHRVHDIACVARRVGTECDDGSDLRYAHSSIRPGDLHGDRFQLCWIDHSRTEDCGWSCCPIQPCLSTDLDHGIGRHGNFGGRSHGQRRRHGLHRFACASSRPNAGSDGRDDFRHAHNSDRPGDLYSDCF